MPKNTGLTILQVALISRGSSQAWLSQVWGSLAGVRCDQGTTGAGYQPACDEVTVGENEERRRPVDKAHLPISGSLIFSRAFARSFMSLFHCAESSELGLGFVCGNK